MLTLEIDHRGVRALQGLRKPGLRAILPKDWKEYAFRWRILDGEGRRLVEGGFDPGPVCLDPALAGQPPRSFGDTVLPNVLHTNVKVPDFALAAGAIEFFRVEGEQLIPFGALRLEELRIR